MNEITILPTTSVRNARAQAALDRIERLMPRQARPHDGAAKAIASTLAAAVEQAVSAAVPFGRKVDIQMTVDRQDADGSRTTATLALRCGGRDE